MKTRKLIKFTALSMITLAVTSLSSCLKDSRFVNYAAAGATVELPLDASSGQFQAAAFAIVSTPTILPVIINLASPSTMSSAVTVTLAVNPALVTAYNTANSTNYVILPAADYSIPSLTVTIPAGQRTAQLSISINTSLVDPSGSFLLPITITSASNGIPVSIYNTLLYNVQAKNQYDGNYACTGYVFHPSSPRAIAATYAFSTAGAASLKVPVGDLGGSNDYFNMTISGTILTNFVGVGATPGPSGSGAGSSGFMTADNPGGTAFTTNPTPQPGVAPYTSTAFPNTYNATTKTFLMHYGYISTGATNQTQNAYTRQFYEQAVKQ